MPGSHSAPGRTAHTEDASVVDEDMQWRLAPPPAVCKRAHRAQRRQIEIHDLHRTCFKSGTLLVSGRSGWTIAMS